MDRKLSLWLTVGLSALAGCASQPPGGVSSDLELLERAESGVTDSSQEPPAVDGDEDMCSDEAKAARLEHEACIAAALLREGCLPNNLRNEPCRGLYAEWLELKNENAICGSEAAGQTLCDYYRTKYWKYWLINLYCTTNAYSEDDVPPEMRPMTLADYCRYGATSMNYFAERMRSCVPVGGLEVEAAP
jgi:hypothetical protein